jgi:SOS-response transcriptional repressor LexA
VPEETRHKIDQRILDYLIRFKTNHDGNSPTFRQIMKACGITSTSVVHYYLQRMRVNRLIKIEAGHKGIEVIGGKWTYKAGK